MSNTFSNITTTEETFIHPEKVRDIKTIKSFSLRSFFLPEEQVEAKKNNESDKVLITLQHQCPNPKCLKILDSDRIMGKSRREELPVDGINSN